MGSSYVDHAIGDTFVFDNMIQCAVYEESILNFSDHLPIAVSLKIDGNEYKSGIDNNEYSRINWRKMSETQI